MLHRSLPWMESQILIFEKRINQVISSYRRLMKNEKFDGKLTNVLVSLFSSGLFFQNGID